MESKRVLFETARLAMAKAIASESLDAGMATLLRISSQTLQVGRVGIWAVEQASQRLVCTMQFDQAADTLTSGDVLEGKLYPAYWASLFAQRAVVADDALRDPRTLELAHTYLRPLGIVAMLDVPVYRAGQVVAIVCHEQTVAERKWEQSHIEFATSVAELVSTLMEHHERLAAERRLAMEMLRQRDASQLDALQRMGAAVAHDFRNVCTALQLLVPKLESLSPEVAGTIRATVNLGQFLTSQLESFSLQAIADQRAACDAVAVIQKLAPLLRILTRATSPLQFELPEAEVWVGLPSGALAQVLLNLVLNAREAVEAVASPEIHIALRCEGAWAILTVRDNGRGLAADQLSKIFDWGYRADRGGDAQRGLGLAIVGETLTLFGASIQVGSEGVGRGAEFIMHIPVHG